MKQLLAYCLSIILCVSFTGCMENYLDLYPEDKITSASFPENESDIKLLLNGVYAQLREKEVYNQGLFGFGITDGATPNAFNWGTDEEEANEIFSDNQSRIDMMDRIIRRKMLPIVAIFLCCVIPQAVRMADGIYTDRMSIAFYILWKMSEIMI